MRRTPFSIVAVIALSGLVLAAAGCGGGKKATSSAQSAAKSATKSETKATSTAKLKYSSALSGLASAGNCAQLVDLSTGLSQAISGTGGRNVEKTEALLKQFADRTPKDIRPDIQTVAAAYQKVVDALKGVDLTPGKTPSPAVIAKLSKLGTQDDDQALTKAYANIGAWAQKNCK